jgi:hypothetical protein
MTPSIQHGSPYSLPRHEHGPWQYAPPVNHWLRMILAGLQKIRCLLTCVSEATEYGAYNVAPATDIQLLPANIYSKAVTVTNTGARSLVISEGGAAVAIVHPQTSKELPMDGLRAIVARVWEHDVNVGTASATATRRTRCGCGEIVVEYDTEPVGSYLL